jgi:hypothetical protein
MPVLISAVAIQLTMGLDKYMLNYFKDIYVLKDDYHYGYYSAPSRAMLTTRASICLGIIS